MLRRTVLAAVVTALALTTASAAGASPPPLTKNIANRGASSEAPENTLTAIDAVGGRTMPKFVRVQVQRSKDNQLVVLHDRSLARTTDVEKVFPERGPWHVVDFTLAEIKRLDAGSWKNAKYKGERVPTLAEVLATVEKSGAVVQLEVRNHDLYPGIDRQLADALIAGGGSTGRSAAWCRARNWDFAQGMRKLLPQHQITVIGAPRIEQFASIAGYATTLSVPYEVAGADYVLAAHEANLRIEVWTVDEVPVMRRFHRMQVSKYRVDGIVTNRHAVLDSVLAS